MKNMLIIVLLMNYCAPLSKEGVRSRINTDFQDAVKDNSEIIKGGTLLVHSKKWDIHWKYAAGFTEKDGVKKNTVEDQPFHTASIGKTFTAAVIFQLIQEKKISLSDKIEKFFPKDYLKGLFNYDRTDWSPEVTVQHLLNHTSGIADYFGEYKDTPTLMKSFADEPDRFWTPKELVEFTRSNQKALSKPGEQFHYTDTGYILLGMIVEKVTSKTFEKNLEERFFIPLQMKNTYMHLRSKPLSRSNLDLSNIIFSKKDVTNFKSVSLDWAGGGLITTAEDLLIFHKALREGKILSEKTVSELSGNFEFHKGIYYGNGYMRVKFGDMLFLMAGTPELYGHSGILSTHMFYSPKYDAHIIMNLGSSDAIEKSFELLFRIMLALRNLDQ